MSMVSHASPRTARWLVLSAATLACVGTFNGHSFGWAFLLPSIRAELELGSATVACFFLQAAVAALVDACGWPIARAAWKAGVPPIRWPAGSARSY